MDASESVALQADLIYVFDRLPHHLVPQSFPLDFLVRFGLLCLAWFALTLPRPRTGGETRLRAMVYASLAIAAAGIVLALATANRPEFAAAALRFYWFRLADAFLPLGVAIMSVWRWEMLPEARQSTARVLLAVLIGLAAYHVLDYGVLRIWTGHPRSEKSERIESHADWLDACRWVADNTHQRALFITPRLAQTFKWRAARGEVVNLKDIPQDAAGIVEWKRRLEDIYASKSAASKWVGSVAELGAKETRRLARAYGADYVLTSSHPRLELPRVYHNGTYAVYKIDQ
jgi:hypothetical protein